MYLELSEDGAVLRSCAVQDTGLRIAPAEETADPLLARARTGCPDAFSILVRQHDAMVLRTALRLLGDAEDARDAAQEAFLRLYKYRRRIDCTRELRPWLYRLTVNACRDWAKRHRRLRTAPLGPEDTESLAAPQRSDAGARFDEERAWLEVALSELSPREREAIVLRDLERLETAEVARALGSTQTTVRSQISRARVKLKAAHAAYFGEEQ